MTPDAARPASFFVGVIVEPDAERFGRPHRRDDERAVDAARQERAERHVAHELAANRLLDGGLYFFFPLAVRPSRLASSRRERAPIAPERRASGLEVDLERTSRLESAHFPQQCASA